jgi:hypothetical protein
LEADILALIPDGKFSVPDPADDDKMDHKVSLEAYCVALNEFPEEPRFHAHLGQLLEFLEKPAGVILS